MDGEWHQLSPAESVAKLCGDEALRTRWMRYHLIRDVLKNEPVQVNTSLAARISDAISSEEDYSNVTQFTAGQSHKGKDGGQQHAGQAAGDQAMSVGDGESDARSLTDIDQTSHKKTSKIKTGIAGFAIAASVALVTVVGLNTFRQSVPVGVTSVAGVADVVSAQTVAAVEGDVALPATVADAAFTQHSNTTLPVVEFVSNTSPGSYWSSPDSTVRSIDEKRLNMLLSQHIENSPTSGREGLLPYSRLVGYKSTDQER
jgi:negative regulator of sigma E activity